MKKPTPARNTKAPAQVTQDKQAPASDHDGSGAEAGAQAPVHDTAAAAPTFEEAVAALAAPEFVTLKWPLPSGISQAALQNASIIVRSKSEKGRRRAGMSFTREETVLPYSTTSGEVLGLLISDAHLSVSLRVPKPA